MGEGGGRKRGKVEEEEGEEEEEEEGEEEEGGKARLSLLVTKAQGLHALLSNTSPSWCPGSWIHTYLATSLRLRSTPPPVTDTEGPSCNSKREKNLT